MILTAGSKILGKDKKEFEIVEKIGQGGFGTVYRIHDDKQEPFALKTLPQYYSSETISLGLENEAKNALNISGENVINYLYFHDGKTHNSLPPYIIMEYAEGGTLRDYIEAGNLSLEQKLPILLQLIRGISLINQTLIHRDLKPENILFKGGVVKISDFGLSKILEDSTRIKSFKGYGTPLYMSPEGWRNQKNTVSMDIYSMGIIFYELITGTYPFNYDSYDSESLKEAHLYGNITSPHKVNSEIPFYLSQIVVKMCRKSPNQRYENWEDIEKDFKETNNTEYSKYEDIIQRLVVVKIDSDSQAEARRLEAEKKQKENEEHLKRVNFQLKDEVIKLFKDFLEDLQKKLGEKYHYHTRSEGEHIFGIFGRGNIKIEFEVLQDKDFVRKEKDLYDFHEASKRVVRPEYEGELIQGWGKVYSDTGIGFNIILYGDLSVHEGNWVMLQSTNSASVGEGRHTKLNEPFGFELNELEREVKLLNAMHVYNTTRKNLSIDFFAGLVEGILAK